MQHSLNVWDANSARENLVHSRLVMQLQVLFLQLFQLDGNMLHHVRIVTYSRVVVKDNGNGRVEGVTT